MSHSCVEKLLVVSSASCVTTVGFSLSIIFIILCPCHKLFLSKSDNNNNNQYIYKHRQSHAMSQRRWLATAVIFRPSDVSLGYVSAKSDFGQILTTASV